MRRLRVTAALAAFAFAVAACGSGSSGSSVNTGNSSTIGGLSANNKGTVDVTGKTTGSIDISSYYFTPSVLKGTPGQKLTLHLVNGASLMHNFTVDAEHISSDIDGHGSVDVNVTMPPSGVLSFWCRFHKDRGMVGGLLVSGSVAGSGPASTPSSSGSGSGYGGYGNG